MLGGWLRGEAGEACDGKTDVETADNVGVNEFTENLAMSETFGRLKSFVLFSAFRGAFFVAENGDVRIAKRNESGGIGFTRARCGPSMCVEDAIDVGFTA